MGCVSTAVRCYTCFSLQCSSRENHGSEVCAPDLALIQRPARRRGHRTEREPGAPDRRREVTASPNQATPRCELYNNNNNTELETLQVLRSACPPTERVRDQRGSFIAAAARCCCTLLRMLPPLLLLPAACALLAHDGHHRSCHCAGASRARLQLMRLQPFVGPPRVLPHVASPHP